MTSQFASTLSAAFFIAGGVLLVLSIFLFFYDQIPKTIGDLNGSNARKTLEKIRQSNELSGVKLYQSSSTNENRGPLTFAMPAGTQETDLIPDIVQEDLQNPQAQTTTLDENNLGSAPEVAATTLLETNSFTEELESPDKADEPHFEERKIWLIKEILITDTDEVIA